MTAVWQNVSKHYGKTIALKPLELSLKPGETTALLGPNGAGKTTAIRLILGLTKPTQGQVRVFGENPNKRSARAKIGAMLQHGLVPENLKVEEHLELFRSYYPEPKTLSELLEICDLKSKSNARFGNLSGGQKQRMLFALALVGNPKLLFMDEPTVGMDVTARKGFWQQVEQQKQSGTTILVTTHYLEEAQSVADRIVVLDRGQVISDTTPKELRSMFGQKKVSFQTSLQQDQIEGWGEFTFEKGHVELLTAKPEKALNHFLNLDPDLNHLEVQSLSLEEAYLALTQKEEIHV